MVQKSQAGRPGAEFGPHDVSNDSKSFVNAWERRCATLDFWLLLKSH